MVGTNQQSFFPKMKTKLIDMGSQKTLRENIMQIIKFQRLCV